MINNIDHSTANIYDKVSIKIRVMQWEKLSTRNVFEVKNQKWSNEKRSELVNVSM